MKKIAKKLCAIFIGISLLNMVFTVYAGNLTNDFNSILVEKSKQTSSIENNPSSVEDNNLNKKARYALVFFFEASCPHCQRFAPVLKAFTDDTHLPVYAFTVDGGTLPDWQKAIPANRGLINSFFSQSPVVVPAIFLVNVNTLQTVSIGTGEMSLEELESSVSQSMERQA